MNAYIYRCRHKPDMYIYLAEEDNFDNVPKNIFNRLGIIEFCMQIKLTKKTKLAREDVNTVMENLKQYHFHLQLADKLSVDEIMAKIAKSHSKKCLNTKNIKKSP